MNRRVSFYLDKLSAGRFTLSFDTLKENKSGEFRDKISINVVDNHTHANSRSKLSGGQTRLVDIATILTLYDLQSFIQDIKFNIMIFDEIFDSLDEENIRHVANLLKTLIEDKSIFVISHRHIDTLEADNHLNMWN
jgi:DNA repair exonuclease SbcCD ATPase subunit